MKMLLIVSLAASLLAPLQAGTYKFEWDPVDVPVDGYELLMRETVDVEWQVVSTTAETVSIAEMPDTGFHTAVRSFRAVTVIYNDPGQEAEDNLQDPGRNWSGLSRILVMPPKPPAPKGLVIEVFIQIRHTEDLTDPRELLTVTYPLKNAEFFQVTQP